MNLQLKFPSRHVIVLAALWLCALAAPQARGAGASLLNVYSFTTNLTPEASLVIGTNGDFYGTTFTNGSKGQGSVFEISAAGVYTNLVTFNGTNGAAPAAPLLLAKSGYFYGTTSAGGSNNNGTIFRMTHSGVLITLARFEGTNGSKPYGPLVVGPQGLFYGTTSAGGTNARAGLGTVFAWSPSLGISNMVSFKGTNGSNPRAGLVYGLDGNLYGTTSQGGANGLGTVFQITPSNTFKTLASFAATNGSGPWGLVQTSDTNFFGTASSGGSSGYGSGYGTIFKITPAGRLTTLASFAVTNGSNPNPILLGADGFLYGTTLQGGSGGNGVVFRISTSGGSISNLATFHGGNGAYPQAGLTQGGDGNIYGTTTAGGANGFGTVFELTGLVPTIFSQPANHPFATNATARFKVGAAGSGPLSFQWMKGAANLSDGVKISGSQSNILTLTNESLADAGSYSVVITNAYGSVTSAVAELSLPTPTLTINPPPTNVNTAMLKISGSTAGLFGITNVQYQFNGGAWTSIVGAKEWANWSVIVSLQGGNNTFKAYSVDPGGFHSRTNTVTIFYTTRTPLTLITNGIGTISRNFAIGSVVIDQSYAVRAVPGGGYLFSNWTGSVTNSADLLTFLMTSNMVLQANFVPNPYPLLAGRYDGLFQPTNGASVATSGLLKNLIVGPHGGFSATLLIAGTNYSIAGAFDVAGHSTTNIQRGAGLGALTLTLNFDWTSVPPQITGTVQGKNGGSWTSVLLAEQAATAATSAEYTLLIPPGTNGASYSPVGQGYALITNHSGIVTLRGALADRTAFSENVAQARNGDLPVYASPYTNGGLLTGLLNLSSGAPVGNLTWITLPSTNSLFINGFTNSVTVESSAWTNMTPAISLPVGTLDISGGALASPLSFIVSVNTTNEIVAISAFPTNSLAGTIDPKTGHLKITFGNGVGKATSTANGAILQNSDSGGGYFIRRGTTGNIDLHP